MKVGRITCLFMLFCLMTTGVCSADSGVSVKIETSGEAAQEIRLYSGYHALVVGVSKYDHWPDLPNAAGDAREVHAFLKRMGFDCKLLIDPDYSELTDALNTITYEEGLNKENALLFYFAGHGETETLADGTKLGYLIPKDCPLLLKDPKGFVMKAVSMKDIEAYSLRIRSKHTLMLFDSCFSGSIFTIVREAPERISRKIALPVRQYITAGQADEAVPDESMFKRSLLIGLEGDADLTGDGYITGSELGTYLSDRVARYTKERQHPQYGKMNNPDLDRGDFVFVLADSGAQWSVPAEPVRRGVGHLEVRSEVSGAKVFVDGKDIGAAPVFVPDLAVGVHRVRVVKEGYEDWEDGDVRIEAGQKRVVWASLKALSRKGRLFVTTDPDDASVNIAGIGRYVEGMALDPGRYHVEVSRDGFETKDQWVVVGALEDKEIRVALNEQPEHEMGEIWVEPVTGMEFVWVPGGCYEMGCGSWTSDCIEDEKPVHEVCVDGFWMGRYEVTQEQWKKLMEDNPAEFKSSFFKVKKNHPIERVTWKDIQDFISKLNSENYSGNEFRLPTEAEWEYACRSGGKLEKYSGGNNVDQVAWYSDNSKKSTQPIGTKDPNGLGIYDMSGNVWEWCEDIYSNEAYLAHSKKNPNYQGNGSFRVLRGGSWLYGENATRCANRRNIPTGFQYSYIGFRLVKTP